MTKDQMGIQHIHEAAKMAKIEWTSKPHHCCLTGSTQYLDTSSVSLGCGHPLSETSTPLSHMLLAHQSFNCQAISCVPWMKQLVGHNSFDVAESACPLLELAVAPLFRCMVPALPLPHKGWACVLDGWSQPWHRRSACSACSSPSTKAGPACWMARANPGTAIQVCGACPSPPVS